MKVHVLGPGAIGSLVAFHLKRATAHPVVLHYRRPPPHTAHTIRFAFTEVSAEVLSQSGFLVEQPQAKSCAREHIAALVVTTKAQQVRSALQDLASTRRLSSASTVFLLCNGLPSLLPTLEDIFAAPNGPALIVGHTSHGVHNRGDGCWVHAGHGKMVCAAVPSSSLPPTSQRDLQSALEACTPLNVTFVDYADWRAGALSKLSVNCAVNAASALIDTKNGALLLPSARPFIEAVLGEVAAVFAAAGETGALSHTDLVRTTMDMIETTKANVSSTLADIRRVSSSVGEDVDSYTELAHMNGYISRVGQQHGIPTPLNDALVALVETKGRARAMGI